MNDRELGSLDRLSGPRLVDSMFPGMLASYEGSLLYVIFHTTVELYADI